MSFKDDLKKDAEQYGAGKKGDFFQFEKTGVYKLRILTKPVALATHFFGKGVPSSVCYGEENGCPFHGGDGPSIKYVAYAINRADNKIVLAEIPKSAMWQISDYSEDEDYTFTDYPMPYDIKVTVDKDALPKDMYKLMPSPTRAEITSDERGDLGTKLGKMTIEAYVEKRKNDSLQKHKEDGTWEREQERRTKLQEEIDAGRRAIEAKGAGAEDEIVPEDIPF